MTGPVQSRELCSNNFHFLVVDSFMVITSLVPNVTHSFMGAKGVSRAPKHILSQETILDIGLGRELWSKDNIFDVQKCFVHVRSNFGVHWAPFTKPKPGLAWRDVTQCGVRVCFKAHYAFSLFRNSNDTRWRVLHILSSPTQPIWIKIFKQSYFAPLYTTFQVFTQTWFIMLCLNYTYWSKISTNTREAKAHDAYDTRWSSQRFR